MYGTRELPESVRDDIDAVFAVDGVATRTPPGVTPLNSSRMADDQRRTREALQQAEVTAGMNLLSNAIPTMNDSGAGSFDEYVETSVQSMQDLSRIYRGIEYLKYLDGEKHLLFVTERGLVLPRAEDDKGLAAVAADARVVIDIIHTGGTGGGFNWAASTSRTVSELTGGYFTSVSYATKAVERINDMSQFSYLLGYSPTNATWDGKYRRINITVNRRGAKVLYRHGYFGRAARAPMDRAAVLSMTRVSAAATFGAAVTDIELRDVLASPATSAAGKREVLVEFTLSSSRMVFGEEVRGRSAKFDIAVFVGDEGQRLIGQTWQTIQGVFEPERHARFVRDGMPLTVRLPIPRSATYAKVIVYDYGSDLLGSAQVRVRKKK